MDKKQTELLQLKGKILSELQANMFNNKRAGKPIDHLQRAILSLQKIDFSNLEDAETELSKLNEWINNLDYVSNGNKSFNNKDFIIVYEKAKERLHDLTLEYLITKNEINPIIKKYYIYIKCITFDLKDVSAAIAELREQMKNFEMEWEKSNNGNT